jgi:putative MATE family efflux protein
MRTLILMHASNIGLNWVLIYGNLGAPALGATGAGVASAIATWLGTIYYFTLGVAHARRGGFLRGLPDGRTLVTMVRLSVPAGFQQFFFAAGMMAFYAIVAQLGTRELAATNVVINLFLVGILPGLGFGLAGASLVGQALGRGDAADARRWGWDVAKIAMAVVAFISVPGVVVPELLLAAFLHDQQTLELAVLPLRVVSIGLFYDSAGSVWMNSLVGAGDTTRVMLVSALLQWVLFLPVAYYVGPWLGWGLAAVWIANVAYRALQTTLFGALWRADGWTRIRV